MHSCNTLDLSENIYQLTAGTLAARESLTHCLMSLLMCVGTDVANTPVPIYPSPPSPFLLQSPPSPPPTSSLPHYVCRAARGRRVETELAHISSSPTDPNSLPLFECSYYYNYYCYYYYYYYYYYALQHTLPSPPPISVSCGC